MVSGSSAELLERVTAFEELNLKGGEVILDIGAGILRNGLYAFEKGADVVMGIDPIPGMLKVGKKKATDKGFGGKVDVVVADARFIPCRYETFDASISLEVLEHIPVDADKVFREIFRVLKPGGRVVVNTWSAVTCVRDRRRKNAGYFKDDFYYKFYLPGEFKTLLENIDFKMKKIRGHSFTLLNGALKRVNLPNSLKLELAIERATRNYIPLLSILLGQYLIVNVEK